MSQQEQTQAERRWRTYRERVAGCEFVPRFKEALSVCACGQHLRFEYLDHEELIEVASSIECTSCGQEGDWVSVSVHSGGVFNAIFGGRSR